MRVNAAGAVRGVILNADVPVAIENAGDDELPTARPRRAMKAVKEKA